AMVDQHADVAAHDKEPTSSRNRRWRSRIVNRAALKRLAILGILVAIFLTWAYFSMIRMPGRSFRGPLPPLTERQASLAEELRRDVEMLAGIIGPRNVYHERGLQRSRAFLEKSLRDAG